jgi:hypothetical protein
MAGSGNRAIGLDTAIDQYASERTASYEVAASSPWASRLMSKILISGSAACERDNL